MEFFCGQERFVAGPGDYVFVPRGTPHAFNIITPTVRLIILVSSVDERAVGIDRYFMAMSTPATSMQLPDGATTYATGEDPAHAVRMAADHGTRFLAPDEAGDLLCGYPDFGAWRS